MNDSMKFEELLERAYELDNSPEKVAVLEQAVREADALQDVDCGMEARMMLVEASTFCGYQEKALVAFSWCLGQVDKDPERYDEGELLWSYKWVLDNCHAFPQISRGQLERMLDDFQLRLERQAGSPRAALYMRWSCLMHLGDLDEAEQTCGNWQRAPRDQFADCPACEQDKRVQLLIYRRQDEAALAAAQPILSGRMSCGEIPHITLAYVLEPLARLGRADEAEAAHAKGYRLVSKNREFVVETARHLLYLTSRNELAKGLKLLERHLPWGVETACLDRRFHMYMACGLLLERLAAEKDKPRKLRLPRELPCHRDDDTYQPAELAAWFLAEADALGNRFNQRNGNQFFTQLAASHRQLVRR